MPRTINKPELVLARLVAALRKLDEIVEEDPQIPDVVIDLADAVENFENALYNFTFRVEDQRNCFSYDTSI